MDDEWMDEWKEWRQRKDGMDGIERRTRKINVWNGNGGMEIAYGWNGWTVEQWGGGGGGGGADRNGSGPDLTEWTEWYGDI